MTLGASCPMRKKGKCIFSHGSIELRVKDTRRERWGKIHTNENLCSSGGEDVLLAARSIEKYRVMEGTIGEFERSNAFAMSYSYKY